MSNNDGQDNSSSGTAPRNRYAGLGVYETLRRAGQTGGWERQAEERAQAIREQQEANQAMITRTNRLAAMSDEERVEYWRAEAEAAEAAQAMEATRLEVEAWRDRVQRWRRWLDEHPRTYGADGTPRNYRADQPPAWFE